MTLSPVNNPAAGGAQRTRTGRHFSGMTRRDLAFVHLHRPVKAAYLKAIVRAALERDPEKRIPVFFNIGHFPNLSSHRISRGDHSTPDLPPRLGRDYGVPQDSRDEELDRAARNRSSADRPRGAVKAVTADIWTRCFLEKNLNMHKNVFTPENAAMLL